jgi:hypothetical protein
VPADGLGDIGGSVAVEVEQRTIVLLRRSLQSLDRYQRQIWSKSSCTLFISGCLGGWLEAAGLDIMTTNFRH